MDCYWDWNGNLDWKKDGDLEDGVWNLQWNEDWDRI